MLKVNNQIDIILYQKYNTINQKFNGDNQI